MATYYTPVSMADQIWFNIIAEENGGGLDIVM